MTSPCQGVGHPDESRPGFGGIVCKPRLCIGPGGNPGGGPRQPGPRWPPVRQRTPMRSPRHGRQKKGLKTSSVAKAPTGASPPAGWRLGDLVVPASRGRVEFGDSRLAGQSGWP
jgi:hypothetical protein